MSLIKKAKELASETERNLENKLNKLKNELQAWQQKYKSVNQELELSEKRFETLSSYDHTPQGYNLKKLKASGEATAILVLSDWHLAEVVDPSTVNNLNTYDVDIAIKRVKTLFERTAMMIDVARGLSKIDTLVVAAIGDFISGALHDDQKETDELSPTESIILGEDLLTSGLSFLKRECKFSNIQVVTCWGNHGRTTQRPRNSTAYKTSYEQLMYWHLAKTYKEVSWKVENGYHNYLDIYGRIYRFHHGDCIKYFGGVGGLQIPAMKAIADWDRTLSAYHDVFGHYHTTAFQRKYTSNGSVVGFNDFAIRNKCAYEEPAQSLIISSRKRGNVLSTSIFTN
ncbi:MAG: metallophosphoesterase [Patescibacteria group bacterium]|nr:metallophosphoesterase [Patescibacteria group bacterium]MDE2438888.1 metallophosphoesterase [Patescibacteria group bacterium]